LLPGLPGIPAPEFCPLGAVTWPPAGGAVVCAEAGSVTTASAVANVSNFNMTKLPFDTTLSKDCRSLENAAASPQVPRPAYFDSCCTAKPHRRSGSRPPAFKFDDQFGDRHCCRITAMDQSQFGRGRFKGRGHLRDLFWVEPVFVFEERPNRHVADG
jgi:hypothetical protein